MLAERLKAMGSPKYRVDGDPSTSGPSFALTLHSGQLEIPCRWRAPRVVFVKTITGLLSHGQGPVEGLRSTLPEEFLPWYDTAVAAVTAKADKRIRLYESLTRQTAIDADDDSDRAFAFAAQQLAADNGVHSNPIFALRNGRADARLAIWGQTKPSGAGDHAAASATPSIG